MPPLVKLKSGAFTLKAVGQPVTFKKDSFIRIGSYTKPLRDYPTMEAQLWDKLRLTNFEKLAAKSDLQRVYKAV